MNACKEQLGERKLVPVMQFLFLLRYLMLHNPYTRVKAVHAISMRELSQKRAKKKEIAAAAG